MRRIAARSGWHRASRTSPMSGSSPRRNASSPSPSMPTTGPPSRRTRSNDGGLDVFQADAAAAVAGHEPLVLVVGPAGTGKTTALRRAVDDLHHQQRPVFGVAPTAKAAKVLCDETGMAADTVAKLQHVRSARPLTSYRLPPGSTVVVDEAGMLGTGALDDLVRLAVSQQWRLALIGDPRQLQAVGRGGMFDELCRTCRTHHLAIIHRFHHRWEQAGRSNCDAATCSRSTPTSTTAGSPPEPSTSSPRRRPAWIELTAAGCRCRRRGRDQRARRRPQCRHPTSTPPPGPARRHGDAIVAGEHRTSVTWWRPAATTELCAPTGANRCATGRPGPSPPSTGRRR